MGVWCRILREHNLLKIFLDSYIEIFGLCFFLQANAASSAEEDGEMEDEDNEVQQPTVLKVKLFNK